MPARDQEEGRFFISPRTTGGPECHGHTRHAGSQQNRLLPRTASFIPSCEFGRKYSEMEDLGPGSQDSSPVDLKVCDCFQALNMAISTTYRRPSIKRHIGSFLTLEGVKTAERWKTSYHFL